MTGSYSKKKRVKLPGTSHVRSFSNQSLESKSMELARKQTAFASDFDKLAKSILILEDEKSSLDCRLQLLKDDLRQAHMERDDSPLELTEVTYN